VKYGNIKIYRIAIDMGMRLGCLVVRDVDDLKMHEKRLLGKIWA
jgi:hypothetical protein